ncbi:ABC transporter permease [Halostreptopolyspora alba]|uniref:ABC transporter permease n=1 Tax=Halostreptopolyspora alba TaxID=2487137 RepID=A0A3N0EDZ9_9ACTN|nr:ABC transporter permease [Nocardiopsaceae bacterium YIM 96095]
MTPVPEQAHRPVRDTLVSEWLKTGSTRAIWFVAGGAVLIVLAVTALTVSVVAVWEGLPQERRSDVFLTPPAQIALLPLQLCVGVLGVLAFTSEYGTGMIRSTFAAVPRRGTVLAAKTLVTGSVALVIGYVGILVTFGVSWWIAGDRSLGFNTGPPADQLPMLLASGLSVVVVALVSVGLGAVLRSTTAAVVLLVLLLYVLPMSTGYLPAPWDDRVASVMLANLHYQVGMDDFAMVYFDGLLSPPAALALMATYVAVTLGAAAVVVGRRDT